MSSRLAALAETFPRLSVLVVGDVTGAICRNWALCGSRA